MPNCITHFLHSKEVFSRMKVENKVNINKNAFTWGAQGPDFLFCHRYFPWMKGESIAKYGTLLHSEEPIKIFPILRDFLMENNDSVFISYVYGFICHYALDSIAHPYVNWLAKELTSQKLHETETTLHAEIESAIDAIMLRDITGKLPTEIKLQKLFPRDEHVQRAIAHIYNYLIERIFNVDIGEDIIYQSTADARKTFIALTDRTTLKSKIVRRIEKGRPSNISSHLIPVIEDSDIDYANIHNFEWDYKGVERTESFFELFENACTKGVEIAESFWTVDFVLPTGNIPFEG